MQGAQILRNEAYLLYVGLAALPALGQGAPWPTRVSARAGSQAFYEVVNSSVRKVTLCTLTGHAQVSRFSEVHFLCMIEYLFGLVRFDLPPHHKGILSIEQVVQPHTRRFVKNSSFISVYRHWCKAGRCIHNFS